MGKHAFIAGLNRMMNTIDGMTTRAETTASTQVPFLQPQVCDEG